LGSHIVTLQDILSIYFLTLTYEHIYQTKFFTKKVIIFILAVLMKASIPSWFQLSNKLINILKYHWKKDEKFKLKQHHLSSQAL